MTQRPWRFLAISATGALPFWSQALAVTSPCIDICRMDGKTGYCVACVRTLDEIRRWRKMTDHQCRRVLAEAPKRKRQLGERFVSEPEA